MFTWTYIETGVESGVILVQEPDNSIKVSDNEDEQDGHIKTIDISAEIEYSKGNVAILNNYPANHQWNIAYDKYAQELEDAGFSVTRIYSYTVSDFKNLQKFNSLILVNSHGQTSNGTPSGDPAICSEEVRTKENAKTYSVELKRNNIKSINGKYWIFPSFFEDTYKNDKLRSPIVHLGICRGYANDKLVKAIYGAGAAAVSGYDATVSTGYDEPMVDTFINRLLLGDAADEAWAYAKDICGQDGNYDSEWKDYATLCCYSGENDTLYHELLNGNFDSLFNLLGNGISTWERYGDARSIFKLSGIYAKSFPKMAIISSGFGSMNDATTSCIYQTILIPEGTSTITFSYDVVSEEPMEFVGTKYNDIFSADILSTNGTVLENLAFESVNTSTWYAVDGINFPGGDDTTYHTRWNSVSSDAVKDYTGQLVVLRFAVQDAGDAIYDTAVLIDSITIQ